MRKQLLAVGSLFGLYLAGQLSVRSPPPQRGCRLTRDHPGGNRGISCGSVGVRGAAVSPQEVSQNSKTVWRFSRFKSATGIEVIEHLLHLLN